MSNEPKTSNNRRPPRTGAAPRGGHARAPRGGGKPDTAPAKMPERDRRYHHGHTTPLLRVMIDAVLKAARGLIRDFGEVEHLQVSRKGPGDFVSQADLRADEILREALAESRPDYGFLTEESGLIKGKDTRHRWIIDPLDGTTNFLHGIPHWSISVGLERDGEIVAGVIYDPVKQDMFMAEKGHGAFCNQQRLRVSARTRLEESLFATGIPFAKHDLSDWQKFLTQCRAVMSVSSGIRRFGSAALDMAYVAAGKCEGYWEGSVNYHDVAAGLIIVREAGGIICHTDGSTFSPDKLGNILAITPDLLDKMIALLRV